MIWQLMPSAILVRPPSTMTSLMTWCCVRWSCIFPQNVRSLWLRREGEGCRMPLSRRYVSSVFSMYYKCTNYFLGFYILLFNRIYFNYLVQSSIGAMQTRWDGAITDAPLSLAGSCLAFVVLLSVILSLFFAISTIQSIHCAYIIFV